jgi:hypothetical protein
VCVCVWYVIVIVVVVSGFAFSIYLFLHTFKLYFVDSCLYSFDLLKIGFNLYKRIRFEGVVMSELSKMIVLLLQLSTLCF